MNRQPLEFVPLHSSSTGDSILGYRSNAGYLDLVNEADLRQGAAQHLLSLLSCLVDFDESDSAEIAGCFLAVQLLSGDVAALQRGAYQCWRQERHGGEQ